MQREERDKEGGGKNNRVSKWVGFNDADCNDPSRVPIDESDSYKKHVEAKQSAKAAVPAVGVAPAAQASAGKQQIAISKQHNKKPEHTKQRVKHNKQS